MALQFISNVGCPNYLALSTDVVDDKIDNATLWDEGKLEYQHNQWCHGSFERRNE